MLKVLKLIDAGGGNASAVIDKNNKTIMDNGKLIRLHHDKHLVWE